MSDQAKGTVYSKQQLEIEKIEPNIPYGQNNKTLDRVTVKNLSLPQDNPLYNKPLRHAVYSDSIKTYLNGKVAGFRFIADVEERESNNPDYGPSRTIIQVYDNGEPVSKKGGNRGNYGNKPSMSPEQWAEKDRIERRSIERQQSAKIAASTFVLGTFDANQFRERANIIYAWISNQLVESPAPAKSPPDATKSKSTADEDWDKMNRGDEQKPPQDKPVTAEERLNKAMTDNGYNMGQIKTYIYKTYGVTDWKKLTAAQYNELLTAVTNCQIAKQ